MGANVSKSISNTTSKIINELEQKAKASATSECSVTTGNITLKNANRCSVTNENRCTTNVSAALDSISEAAARAWSEATNEQKTSLLPGVNVNDTVQNVASIIKTKLNQSCEAGSNNTLKISTGDIVMDGCIDSEVQNINAGSAEANCAVKTIISTIVQADAKLKNSQSTGELFGGLFSGTSITISIVVCVIICLCIILVGGGAIYFKMRD